MLAIQIPYIQTKTVNYLSDKLSESTGFPTTISHVSIDWFDQVSLEGIKVTDPEDNVLGLIEKTQINYDLGTLVSEDVIHFDHATLTKPDVYLTKIKTKDGKDILNINLLIRNIKKLIKKTGGKQKLIVIDQINIENGKFGYHNPSKDSTKDRFDINHFSFEKINTDIADFTQRRDTVTFGIKQLNTTSSDGILKKITISTDFMVCNKQMRFDRLNLKFGNSRIREKLLFTYRSTKDLENFIHEVDIEASLRESIVFTDDLAKFAPKLYRHKEKLLVSGQFKGRVERFTFKDFDIILSNGNSLNGKVSMYGLPDFDETFIDLDIMKANIDPNSLTTILKPNIREYLSELGRTRFRAKFIGFTNDFVANGTFNTQLGVIKSDINLKTGGGLTKAMYNGNLKLIDFDIGEFSNRPLVGLVSLKGEIKGIGLTFESADFLLNGNINSIDIYDYQYTNIATDAHLAQELFEGSLKIDDPNIKMSIDGKVNLRDGQDNYTAKLSLDKALLKPLNLSDKNLLLIGDLDIDAQGLKIDSISGSANFRDVFIEYDGKPLAIDSLQVATLISKNKERAITIQSDLFDTKIEGTYQFTTAVKSIVKLIKEYRLNILNDQRAIGEYYNKKKQEHHKQFRIKFDALMKNFTPVVKLFFEEVSIAKNSKLTGTFSSGYTSMLSLNSFIDTLTVNKHQLYDIEVDVSTSKISDSTNVLAMGYVSSQGQLFANKVKSENLIFEAIWDNDHIDFDFNIEQKEYKNKSRITGEIDFEKEKTNIHFDESSIYVLDKEWRFDIENKIEIHQNDVVFSKFNMSSNDELIAVNGILSRVPDDRVLITFDNIDLEIIRPISAKKIDGQLNGFVEISNYYDSPKINSDLAIDTLSVDDFHIGNIIAKTTWFEESKSLKVKAFLDRNDQRSININGYYYPYNPTDQLDLRASFDKAPLAISEPFLKKIFSNITGRATGTFQITGTPLSPIVYGQGNVSNGGIKINYLNTDYTFEGGFGFTKDKIELSSITLRDFFGHQASLTGHISHDNFQNMTMNLTSNLTNFQILNTSSTDNKLFYGEGYASGNISFTGPLRNMTITAKATTMKGTKIYIPIGGISTIEQEDFIKFNTFTKNTVVNTDSIADKQIDIKGLTMNFDLDITPDAYCELIFDIKSGDIIRGRGSGQVNLQIDTHGEFNMLGEYVLNKGGYNFTLYNVINKEFDLLPDSKISWYGDPYQGILDMNATYSQVTSLAPLIDTTFQNNPAIRRGYPVDVKLSLQGPLLSPQIGFGIDVKDYPTTITGADGSTIYLEDVVNQMTNRIATDEHELNRQVFSLIILRRFSPPESFNTSGTIGNSVSEFVSNQLSYWVSQVDENLEIDVDLGKLDNEALNTFQLRLSYTFLEGRLRVTREGGINNNQNQNDNNVSGIVGDWTVEYLLTPDGKLRAKMYNRTNFNTVNNASLNRANTVTTGFSLIHTQSFDTVRDMIRKSRKKQQKNKEKQSQNNKSAILRDEK